ncbi:MAG: MFS transporter [Chloroflexi bacterium]|nr:MFS transporter [Chloroflexota bacterium]
MSKKRLYLAVAGIVCGLLLGALDQTIVGTAMPRVIASLGGMSLYTWVATTYMLTATTSMPIYGKIADIYGHKRIYILGLFIFMLGSALSGMSQSMGQLILFRGIQGLGAGATMPVAMAIIGDLFPPTQRAKLQGVMGGVFGIASVIGPTAGGYITDNLDWRWVFYVNLPLGLVAAAILLIALPALNSKERRSIDYAGAITMVVAIVSMLLSTAWGGRDYAWLSPQILGLLILSGVAWIAFIAIERRATEPILPLWLFRNSVFSVSAIVVFLSGMGMFAGIMFVPLFVQGVIGESATNSGMITTPMMLSVVVGSIVGGQLIARVGRYGLIGTLGMVIVSGGMFLLAGMNVATSGDVVVRNMIVTGFGLGITMPLFMIAVQNSFERRFMGVVTSSVQFFRSIGGTIGITILGSLMTGVFSSELQSRLSAALPPQLAQGLSSGVMGQLANPQSMMTPGGSGGFGQLPAPLAPFKDGIEAAVKGALSLSIQEVFIAGFFVCVLSVIACFFLHTAPSLATSPAQGRMGAPFGEGLAEECADSGQRHPSTAVDG